jgi:hypothetical protein
MINAHQIETAHLCRQARAPEGKAIPLGLGPAVQRVAPQLSIDGEVIGRNTCERGGPALPVQFKLLRL